MHAKKRFITFTEYERIMNDSLNPCNKFIPIDHPYSLRTIRNHFHIASCTERPRAASLIL